jgi:hypothetical protein
VRLSPNATMTRSGGSAAASATHSASAPITVRVGRERPPATGIV